MLGSDTAGFDVLLRQIQGRITAAAERSCRTSQEITLVAVTKKQPPSAVTSAFGAGIVDFGENYVQEAVEKRDVLQLSNSRWHLLGHLQSNKARTAVKTFDLIQSVDSVRLARQIGKHAEAQGKIQRVLLQVHLGDEETKSGLPPDAVQESASEIQSIPGVSLQGLMGIAPQGEIARPHFQLLKRLFEELPATAKAILSMGMTGDFETAIEEGATMVRIGTALFGARMTREGIHTPAG